KLQVVATGMHLSPEFGLTYREIEADGFVIDRKLEILTSSDSASGVTKSVGLGVIAFADAFAELRPDIVVLLGDRFEIFAAATAAMIAGQPIAHLHGGEVTEGAIDDAIRHSITKMSHLHFVAAEPYRRRVLQLGEPPDRVLLSGGLGVDTVCKTPLLNRCDLEAAIDFRLGKKNLLVTFHPATLEPGSAPIQMAELLKALDSLSDTNFILTMPNADTGGRELIRMVEQFVSTRPHTRAFTSLGQVRYLSCMAHVDGVVGNSSSGLAEAPSFKKGTVNIGDRQRGRLKAASVIDCDPDCESIIAAIEVLYSPTFQARLEQVENPYGNGGASEKIVDVLKHFDISNITKKSFQDMPYGMGV
ncbi:MAG: UDP-N-acetylglucosamine 2-epimerase (hydrolyzing), partial [Gammaproteobacteria bacterium]|nr:UDP-N-acetylglucosamine 2-epimerase (hydrolyzing) [Gammaproteobacteria bacterium]